MASPLSDVGISIKTLEIHRQLEAVRDAEARLNKALVEDGKPKLRPFFYSREQWDEREQEHAAELEAAKPPKPDDWRERIREAKAGGSTFAGFAAALTKARGVTPNAELSAVSALNLIEAALADSRVTSLEMLRETIRPAVMIVPRPQPGPSQRRHIETWLSAVTASWAATPPADEGELAIDGDEDDDLEPADAGPPEASPKPVRVVAAIEDGTVIPIGRVRGEKEKL